MCSKQAEILVEIHTQVGREPRPACADNEPVPCANGNGQTKMTVMEPRKSPVKPPKEAT
jgi:hypothetical protein